VRRRGQRVQHPLGGLRGQDQRDRGAGGPPDPDPARARGPGHPRHRGRGQDRLDRALGPRADGGHPPLSGRRPAARRADEHGDLPLDRAHRHGAGQPVPVLSAGRHRLRHLRPDAAGGLPAGGRRRLLAVLHARALAPRPHRPGQGAAHRPDPGDHPRRVGGQLRRRCAPARRPDHRHGDVPDLRLGAGRPGLDPRQRPGSVDGAPGDLEDRQRGLRRDRPHRPAQRLPGADPRPGALHRLRPLRPGLPAPGLGPGQRRSRPAGPGR